VARTSGFHPGNRGSIPLWTTTFKHSKTLLFAYNQHIKHIEGFSFVTAKIGSIPKIQAGLPDFAHNTIRAYKSSYNSLSRYLNGTDIKLRKLDYQFIEGYYDYLRNVEKLQPNSAYKNIKHLYRVIKVAILNKWLKTNPFKEFHCHYRNPIRPYLTETELEFLQTTTFDTERLTRVRDLFLFQVYTGLSYSDMAALTTANIEVGIDGKKWVIINRQKTKNRCAIPLLPIALDILLKYKYKLPIVCNQDMNRYLKELAAICNITKTLTTHVGRHTFATTICLGHGIPIETVSKLLGHTSLVTTQIYAKITDKKTANDMSCLY
jgi:site-specific recombinase XerD